MSKILMVLSAVLFLCLAGKAQSPVNEVGDEKEPELRKELVKMVVDDQNIRGEFDKFRRARGLFGIDNKTLNEKLNADPQLKKDFFEITMRMNEGDKARTARIKEIVNTYGWPGRSLVGTEASGAAWLMVSHAVTDVPFQRQALELMKKMGPCEVEPTYLAYLTDRVLLAEGKKQLYGSYPTRGPNGELIPKPIEDVANLDRRRAELGLQPFAEYMRRLNKQLGVKK
jgi:hypothetical protein